ncbi:MAG: 16S rRNA (cytosine(967)-C(5))-methyltransferase RsmB [Armatimonadetes bacterium]|nr:16S rRNA (cytosine(967)-C(5))-methyltransferase RsmB [Armatimonadota bacterium]
MTSRPAVPAATPAREAAFAVLYRAEAAEAFVGALLFRTLARSSLSDADRALTTTIVLGVLRHRTRLDHALAALLARPLDTLPAAIRTALRMGAFEVMELDRVPAPAAVSEAVALARRHGHAGTAGLVNAVLRRLAAEGPAPPPDAGSDPVGHLSVVHSHPGWLVSRWVARWGMEEAQALLAANARPVPATLRVNTLRTTRDDLLGLLRAAGLDAGPGIVPEAMRVHGSLVGRLPLYDQGLCAPQDEGAMLVVHALADVAVSGSTVIDACAAPGGKSLHLAALMANRGRVLAVDVHPGKARALARRAAAFGATCVEVHNLDAHEIGVRWLEAADAVLVDAPCSGLGTVRRRPEIKWRLDERSPARCAEVQQAILRGVSGAVRPGGTLVYSVCSNEPEEGPDVVRGFLSEHPSFGFAPFAGTFPRSAGGCLVDGVEAGEVHLLPHLHGTDGFYIARLRRR